jgi:hypothetical protein
MTSYLHCPQGLRKFPNGNPPFGIGERAGFWSSCTSSTSAYQWKRSPSSTALFVVESEFDIWSPAPSLPVEVWSGFPLERWR